MSSLPYILIADDDFEDRYIMSETFRELGCPVAIHMVEDGTKVIEYLSEQEADMVKLIVLDLNMPRLSGTETLRVLKNNPGYKAIPVMIFSTSVNEIEKRICLDLGAKEYITKPTKYAEYVQICKKFYAISQESLG